MVNIVTLQIQNIETFCNIATESLNGRFLTIVGA